MSKLIDRLKQVSRGAGPGLGFKAAAGGAQRPLILAVGSTVEALKGAAGADAFILRSNAATRGKALQEIGEVAGKAPWGMWLERPAADIATKVAQAGADFLLVEPATAPASLLYEGKLGKIARLEIPLRDHHLIGVVADIGIDALLVESGEQGPHLTMQDLMYFRWLEMAAGRPILALACKDPEDVRALWEGGVDGLLVKAEDGSVAQLRKIVAELPARSVSSRSRVTPLLPHLAAREAPEEEESDVWRSNGSGNI